MSKVIDNICKFRDFLQQSDIYTIARDLKKQQSLIRAIFEDVHKYINRRNNEHSQNLDFTALDLRWLAEDIQKVIHKMEDKMCPEKNIKLFRKELTENRELDLTWLTNRCIPIMEARRDSIQVLYELLNLLEFHAVYLYFLELESKDEFAIKYAHDIKV